MIGIKDILDITAPIHGGRDRLADRVHHAKSSAEKQHTHPDGSPLLRRATHKPDYRKSVKLIALPSISDEMGRYRSLRTKDHAA